MKRWTVTFTKHVKQKRKVYQDGVLGLCDSSRKVMLFDDCGKLIDSKFLKKDEVIECGQTLSLEAHLVDVGVPDRNCNPLKDLNATSEKLDKKTGSHSQKGSKTATFCSRLTQNQSKITSSSIGVGQKRQPDESRVPQSQPNVRNTTPKEWDALYTTQITQKTKKYHDGILRLSGCGLYTDQVFLLDEDGAVLGSKFVKSVEFIKSGNTFQLANFLIEICEPRTLEGVLKNSSSEQVASSGCSNIDMFVSAREVLNNKKQSADIKKDTSPNKIGSSSGSGVSKFTNTSKVLGNIPLIENLPGDPPQDVVDPSSSSGVKVMSSRRINSNKSLRDAHQILMTLRKPSPTEKHPFEELLTEQVHLSQSSDDALTKLPDQMANSSKPSGFHLTDVQGKAMITSDASATELDVGCSEKLCLDMTSTFANGTINNINSLPTACQTNVSDNSFTGAGLLWQVTYSTSETVPIEKPAGPSPEKKHLSDYSSHIRKEIIRNTDISTHFGTKGDSNEQNNNFVQTLGTNIEDDELCDWDLDASQPSCAAIGNKCKSMESQSLPNKCSYLGDFPSFELGF